MTGKDRDAPAVLPARELETLAVVPLLEAYFRRAPGEMPDQLARLFSTHGLTARHGAVLAQLSGGEAISVTDLARRMKVSLSTASELVGELSRAGLVERREDPANRRRTLVTLAGAHQDAVRSFVAQRAAPLLRVLDGLTSRDREGFARGLAAWASEIRNY